MKSVLSVASHKAQVWAKKGTDFSLHSFFYLFQNFRIWKKSAYSIFRKSYGLNLKKGFEKSLDLALSQLHMKKKSVF